VFKRVQQDAEIQYCNDDQTEEFNRYLRNANRILDGNPEEKYL
jgi:hypothetical protein